ncbi:hypothetical protein ACFQZ4_07795 [Catellatospora coxensis]|uniref:Uncharacterized protein n=1 Tax=Catellatospora coxensis TaxID=310354 RepID=A0A8J3KNT1_9ACTN|nr:hypothetical protein [Catellatospora coxensis]GIG05933.1 hypothetical protein Cco03nite_26330 [Catellatospora coxensis]
MSALDTLAGAIAGLALGVLAGLWSARRRRRAAPPADEVPLTWCGNCGQPTAALCHEHKRQAAGHRPDY